MSTRTAIGFPASNTFFWTDIDIWKLPDFGPHASAGASAATPAELATNAPIKAMSVDIPAAYFEDLFREEFGRVVMSCKIRGTVSVTRLQSIRLLFSGRGSA
jgi:hypothetical protein